MRSSTSVSAEIPLIAILAGLTRNSADPAGGVFRRDTSGTSVVEEQAMMAFLALVELLGYDLWARSATLSQ